MLKWEREARKRAAGRERARGTRAALVRHYCERNCRSGGRLLRTTEETQTSEKKTHSVGDWSSSPAATIVPQEEKRGETPIHR